MICTGSILPKLIKDDNITLWFYVALDADATLYPWHWIWGISSELEGLVMYTKTKQGVVFLVNIKYNPVYNH